MRKSFYAVLLLLIIIKTSIFAEIEFGPKKDKDIGALAGQIYIYIDGKIWDRVPSGDYYTVDAYIENIATKKTYKTIRREKGFFYLINVPEGQYELKKLDFYHSTGDYTFYFRDMKIFKFDSSGKRTDKGLTFGIYKNTITTLKPIHIITKYSTESKVSNRYERLTDLQPVIDFFKSMDYRNKWSHFEFADLEIQ